MLGTLRGEVERWDTALHRHKHRKTKDTENICNALRRDTIEARDTEKNPRTDGVKV